MRKFLAQTLAVLMTATAIVPALTAPASAGNRNAGAAIVGGIILGTAAAALIANSHRAHADEYYEDPAAARHRRYCARLNSRCDRGNDDACEQYEDDCGRY